MGRLLAIGDIHGCLRAFDTLLAVLDLTAADTLVLLGDYVDRGPDSRGVMERILELRTRVSLVPLFGNHEEMMCQAHAGAVADADADADADAVAEPGEALSMWLLCGGEATLASYAGPPQGRTPEQRLACVPGEHWRFLTRQCRDYYETADHIFVHATALPQVPPAQQSAYSLRWRKLIDPQPHISGKTVVVGHSRQPGGVPRSWGHTVALDTGCYAGEWLTCVALGTSTGAAPRGGPGYVWQANQVGQLRHGPFAKLGTTVAPDAGPGMNDRRGSYRR